VTLNRALLDAAASVLEALRALSWAREEFEPDDDDDVADAFEVPEMPADLDGDLDQAEAALTSALVTLTAAIAGPVAARDEGVPPPSR